MKISVGSTTVEDLSRWQDTLVARAKARGDRLAPWHVTRMFPRRADELLDGGSLYWTIGGYFAVRQKITGLSQVTAEDGTKKCRIDLARKLIPVEPIPRRAFQGWRYLTPEDAPADVKGGKGT
ncbi:MAG: DUF1489 domain-containing protein, partial [Pseudomonadota bacterium]